jgi:chorismate mutase
MRTSFATPCLRRWLGVWLVAFIASGCATTKFSAADTAAVDRLLGLIGQRLDVAPDVARVKWNTKAPIEDLSREKDIIDGVARRASEYRLDPAIAGRFFQGQIEASKTVQNRLHAEWTAATHPPFTEVADLERDIRPVLDRLTPLMMRGLAGAVPVIQQPGGRQLLNARAQALLSRSPGGETAVQQAVGPP